MFKENPDHTAAFKIFHYNFNCTVPALYLYSQSYITTFGISSSGDKLVDDHAALAPVNTNLTIAAMATYYDEGATIGLINPRDSVRIYSYIKQHLTDWAHEMQVDFNRLDVPTEELRMLENFAIEVYKVARNFMSEVPDDKLFGRLNRLASRGMSRRAKPEDIKAQLPESHSPIVDSLAKEQSVRSRARWR